MDDMKSAREIAEERANRLGKFSAEEQRKQKEQECRQIAEGIVRKYLDSPRAEDIIAVLDKYQGEERELVGVAVVDLLTEAVTFDSETRAGRAVQGIVSVEPGTQAVVGRMTDLLTEYHQAGERIRKEVEGRAKELLHQLRISGTAVGGINVEASSQQQRNWEKFRAPLEQQLDALKHELHKGKS